MKISDFAVKHPTIITILLVTLLVFGGIAATNLIQEMFPPVEIPTLAVLTTYPGAAPEDMENQVTDVLEDAIAQMSDLQGLSSTSSDSVSLIEVEFEPGTSLDDKVPALREQITIATRDLPDDLPGQPQIFRFSATFVPVLTVQVQSNADTATLTSYLEDTVVPQLAQISGVAQVELSGDQEQIVRIELDHKRLAARNVTPSQIYQRLRAANRDAPTGTLGFEGDAVRLRASAELDSIRDIRELVVAQSGTDTIRMGELASISITEEEPERYVRSNGEDIVVISIRKRIEGDTNAIVSAAQEVFDRAEREKAGNIEFLPIANTSNDISRAMDSVRNAALSGAVLAVLVLLFFLHDLRYTAIVAVSIPFSILVAITLMFLNGQTLNLLSLGGLTVGIGLMVDSSIVVLENINRNMGLRATPFEAISQGTREVGSAIVASTTTSISVFVPVLFVQGLTGVTLRGPSYAILFALAAALIAAIIVVPYLSGAIIGRDRPRRETRVPGRLPQGIERALGGVTRVYTRILRAALRNKALVFTAAIAVLLMTVLSTSFLGFTFIPDTDSGEMIVELQAPANYSLEETRDKTDQVERVIREIVPEVESAAFWTGQDGPFSNRRVRYEAFGRVRLVPVAERERSLGQIISVVREAIAERVPDVEATFRRGGLNSTVAEATGGEGFSVQVRGPNLEQVLDTSAEIRRIIADDPNVFNATSNVTRGQRQVVSRFDRRYLDRLGVSAEAATVESRIYFDGLDAGTYEGPEVADEATIHLTSTLSEGTITEERLSAALVQTARGEMVPLSTVATLRTEETVPVIHHEDRLPVVQVTGLLRTENVRGTTERVTEQIEELEIPPSVEVDLAGASAEVQRSLRSLATALAVAVFLVYVVMVIQFERYLQPLIVMVAVPFTFIGVIVGLLLFGTQLSIIAFLGIIALAGIVVNNAIVLIDYMNLLRDSYGYSLQEALIEGARTRLRPILMTTLTTLLGITPLALGIGEGSATYAPLGQAIFGGLITSTGITLLLVPLLYDWLEQRIARRGARAGAPDRGTAGTDPADRRGGGSEKSRATQKDRDHE
jgi:HAE1 family hydrophobic/amphiphilic exporter-1